MQITRNVRNVKNARNVNVRNAKNADFRNARNATSLPLQGGRLQYSCCFSGPVHECPAWAGGGLSHSRDLERLAAPQVAEHSVQEDHLPQLPSTARDKLSHDYRDTSKDLFKPFHCQRRI